MNDLVVDLIYVEYEDVREMSVAVINGEDSELIGPTDAKGAVKALAPLVSARFPGLIGDVAKIEELLMMTHFRNITMHQNSSGQAYPFKVRAKKSG
jgi:hypothetical protein